MVPSFNDPEYLADHQGPFMAHAQVCRKFFHMLLWQVAKLGLKVDYGKCMHNYFEDMAAGKGSVVLKVGLIHLADIIVVALLDPHCWPSHTHQVKWHVHLLHHIPTHFPITQVPLQFSQK